MSPRFTNQRSQDGFSLVELMIVIAIMLLLSALAMPRLLDAQKSAYQAGVVSFLRTLQSDQESYRLANGFYSDNFTDLGLATLGPGPLKDFFELQVAAWFPHLGPSHVYAEQSAQQPPANTPPPPPPGKQSFGVQPPKKKTEKMIGGPVGPGGLTPSGGSAVPRRGGSGGARSGVPPSGAGPGSGVPPSGAGTSGGSAGGVPPGAKAPGGGSGGTSSPLAGPAPKSNLLLKHNYIFTLSRPTPTTWTCSVAPIRDRGDSKFFYMDQTGVIRSELGKPASASSPQL